MYYLSARAWRSRAISDYGALTRAFHHVLPLSLKLVRAIFSGKRASVFVFAKREMLIGLYRRVVRSAHACLEEACGGTGALAACSIKDEVCDLVDEFCRDGRPERAFSQQKKKRRNLGEREPVAHHLPPRASSPRHRPVRNPLSHSVSQSSSRPPQPHTALQSLSATLPA